MQSSGPTTIQTVSRFQPNICTRTGRNRSRRRSSKKLRKSTSLRESQRCIEEGTALTHQRHHSHRCKIVLVVRHNVNLDGTSWKEDHNHYPVKAFQSSWIFLPMLKCSASASQNNSRCHHWRQQKLKHHLSVLQQAWANPDSIKWMKILGLDLKAFVNIQRLRTSRLSLTFFSHKSRTFQRQTKTISQTLKLLVEALKRSVSSEAPAISVICQKSFRNKRKNYRINHIDLKSWTIWKKRIRC